LFDDGLGFVMNFLHKKTYFVIKGKKDPVCHDEEIIPRLDLEIMTPKNTIIPLQNYLKLEFIKKQEPCIQTSFSLQEFKLLNDETA
jgi:hypothetical protein